MEQLWILGDKFVGKTAQNEIYKKPEEKFITTNFEVKVFTGDYKSDNQMVLGRLRNVLVEAINCYYTIPKWIVFVVENDLITDLDYKDPASADLYGIVLEKLLNEHKEILNEFKTLLPHKAKKHSWPFIIWVMPTLHDNYNDVHFRERFNQSLEVVELLHENMITLQLEQHWDQKNSSLFQLREQRLTPMGITTLWTAIDKTLKFADSKFNKHHGTMKLEEIFWARSETTKKRHVENNRQKQKQEQQHQQRPNDRFYWQAKRRLDLNRMGRKLPSPPPKR